MRRAARVLTAALSSLGVQRCRMHTRKRSSVPGLSFKEFTNFLDESVAVLDALYWKKRDLTSPAP